MNSKIYVVTHKKYMLDPVLEDKGYALISVGNGKKAGNTGVNDDTGDNISEKNANFCELTALYWIWKNDTNSEYKGLCHYRRYITTATVSKNIEYYVDSKVIEKYLKNDNYDIILPQKQYFTRKTSENYLRCGFQKDLDALRETIKEIYPSYVETFDKVMNSNKSYLMNMMIASRRVFDLYCKWLFDILFELEKKTDLSGYSAQEARIYGYMSERLLTVWVLNNNLKVKEFPFINTEEKKHVIRKILIKLHIYQALKTVFWKIFKRGK